MENWNPISVFELFKVGIGPSSSHTVGPMRAAKRFVSRLRDEGKLNECAAIRIELFGSLGHTGKGHGSDVAVFLGLEGEDPETVDTDAVAAKVQVIREQKSLHLLGERAIRFNEKEHLIFHRRQVLAKHANGMRFIAQNHQADIILNCQYYSIGGGFIDDDDTASQGTTSSELQLRYPFRRAQDLLDHCEASGLRISTLMLENETSWRSKDKVHEGLLRIWEVMEACIRRGCQREGILPGGLKVRRRAAALHRKLKCEAQSEDHAHRMMDWVNLFALAVNEENADGGRVVTAPTNGAAGIIPAVISYYRKFIPESDDEGIVRFLLTAGAIGCLYKANASISGAEVGCQGEVGVACSMAAGGLTEVLGGTPLQVENAAEIAMEHNLGLTCDPVGGLVQVPCIERNAMGAVKAINASRLALQGDGRHFISLDKVIATMRRTGRDMHAKYKETSRGGLAVNIVEC